MITIRPARAMDSAFLLGLRNDPTTYRYFRTPKPVTGEEHRAWFAAVLQGGLRTLYVIVCEGELIGQVRFDAHEDRTRAEVSISIAAHARGGGIGALAMRRAMVRYLAEHVTITTIAAELHVENTASLHLFDRLGFRSTGGEGVIRACALEQARDRLAPVIAVLQARVSSTRLPGKVLKPILGEPMLARQIERVVRSRALDAVIVATSTETSDDPIVALCVQIGIPCSRGSLTNVLDRCYRAVEPYRPASVVRLTGDCPLTDPETIDQVVAFARHGDYDYATNAKPYTFPDGLDVEVIRFTALAQAQREANLPSQREHVTPFVGRQPERFYLGYYRSPMDLGHHRWTVDEPEDFAFVTAVYEALYPKNPAFTTNDILAFLAEHPKLARTATRGQRNEGRQKSLLEDAKVLAAQHAR